MDDLISRRAALDAVEKNACNTQRIMDAVNNLPPAQPEPQWIPCSERVPEDYADVLVWFEYFRYGNYNRMYATHGIGTYVANYNLWTVNHETGWKDLHVFAWMPLPEAYKPNK